MYTGIRKGISKVVNFTPKYFPQHPIFEHPQPARSYQWAFKQLSSPADIGIAKNAATPLLAKTWFDFYGQQAAKRFAFPTLDNH